MLYYKNPYIHILNGYNFLRFEAENVYLYDNFKLDISEHYICLAAAAVLGMKNNRLINILAFFVSPLYNLKDSKEGSSDKITKQ